MPEVRRLFLALTGSSNQRGFRLRWSAWRRAHQAVAARCHALRRTRGRDRPFPTLAASPSTAAPAELTDAEWERVRPLLPPQRPPTGRPNTDHRTVLGGMLWVMGTGGAWRDLPDRFGPWQTVHGRYRRWRQAGPWQRILAALEQEDATTGPQLSL